MSTDPEPENDDAVIIPENTADPFAERVDCVVGLPILIPLLAVITSIEI